MSEYESLARSVRRYGAVLRRQWWVTLLVTLIAIGAAIAYVERATPVYSASSKVVVGQGETLFAPGLSVDVTAFTQTISNLLQSNVVAQEVINDLGLHKTPTSLLSNLQVSAQPTGAVINVSYNDTNKARAVRVLSTFGSIFTRLVDTKLAGRSTGRGNTTTQPVSAVVFDPAHADPGRVSPRTARSLVIAGLLGLIAGILLAFIRDALSTTIKSEAEAEEAYGGVAIGSVPKGALGVAIGQVDSLATKSRVRITEAFRMITARLRYSSAEEKAVIVVVGARPEDGKTTVAAHLAAGLAAAGAEVIAVEADLHRPQLHRLLGLAAGRAGIKDLATNRRPLEQTLVAVAVESAEARTGAREPAQVAVAGSRRGRGNGAQRRPRDRSDGDSFLSMSRRGSLHLLPAGTAPGNALNALSLGNASALISRLRKHADYVVVDTPPLLLAGDAYPLVQLADKVVVVCRRGATRQHEATQAGEILRSLGVSDYSIVLSESDVVAAEYYGYTVY